MLCVPRLHQSAALYLLYVRQHSPLKKTHPLTGGMTKENMLYFKNFPHHYFLI